MDSPASPARAASITARPLSTAQAAYGIERARATAPSPHVLGRSTRTFESPRSSTASASSASPAGSPRPGRRWRPRSGAPAQHHDAVPDIGRAHGSARLARRDTVCPVTSRQAFRASASMQRPCGAGPTMSPSTAPASTEASCSGSPTRISRASGRTASTSRAMSESDTIEVSSTTTTSWGSRLQRSWRNRVRLPGLNPRRRCSVVPSERAAGAHGPLRRPPCLGASLRTASSSRAAALPVGAARAMSGGRAPAAACCSSRSASTRATVVVLPGPGPAGDHRHPPQHGGRGRQALEVRVLARRRTAGPGRPTGRRVDAVGGLRGRARRSWPPRSRRVQSRSGRGSSPRWSGRSRPTTADCGHPPRASRPARATAARRGRPAVGVACSRCRGWCQVDADVAEPRRPGREGGTRAARRRPPCRRAGPGGGRRGRRRSPGPRPG